MDKFRDAYQDAAKELPGLHLDADMVRDELHHYKMKRQRRNYLIVKGCTAAVVFLLCGVGTAAAKSYRDSIIRVNDTGVTITARQAVEEENENGLISPISFFEKIGGVSSIADIGPEEDIEESCELEVAEYDSLEAFLAAESVTVALPDKSLFGTEFELERVCMVGGGLDVSVYLSNAECCFSMTQFDNRGVESYSTGLSFGGLCSNERNFTSRQGFGYVMFDTVDESGDVISVSAVISVNGRDLALTFRGFDGKTIEEIINSIDLSIYFSE